MARRSWSELRVWVCSLSRKTNFWQFPAPIAICLLYPGFVNRMQKKHCLYFHAKLPTCWASITFNIEPVSCLVDAWNPEKFAKFSFSWWSQSKECKLGEKHWTTNLAINGHFWHFKSSIVGNKYHLCKTHSRYKTIWIFPLYKNMILCF